jgi:hypothetical protein
MPEEEPPSWCLPNPGDSTSIVLAPLRTSPRPEKTTVQEKKEDKKTKSLYVRTFSPVVTHWKTEREEGSCVVF